jgi:F0F1-type ATP synthase assembly protein I
VDNNSKDKNNQAPDHAGQAWWEPALVIGGQMVGWIVGPLLLALFLGKWLDNKYQSGPRFLLILVGIAFISSNVGIVLNTINFSKSLDKEKNKKNGNKSDTTNSD